MPIYKTLNDIISMDERYDPRKFLLYGTAGGGELVVPDTSLFTLYMRFVRPYVVTVSVSEAEREYYRFRPYLLSLDIYRTMCLGPLLMTLNDRESASRFYLKRTLRIIPPSDLEDLFDTLSTKSTKRMRENQTRFLSMVGEDV